MNKTISINLGGTFFHIDENAYAKLKSYLDAVSNSLNDDPQGKEEIISDIELRINELLSEKITNERQVVNEKDIDEIINAMGQPEDYQYDDELFTEEASERKSKQTKHKKLFRTKKEGIIGGVSKGLAYYFGIDVIWVRILMLLLLIPHGFSFFAYIILWIIMPDAKTTAEELEMKGEPVTIDNIEKNVKEEYARMEKKIKDTDFSGVKSGLQNLIDGIGRFIVVLFEVFVKFIGALLVIIGGLTTIALFFSLFVWGFYKIRGLDTPFMNFPNYFNLSVIPSWVLIIALILSVLIPFFYLMILGINILSKEKKGIGFSGNLAVLSIWILSLFTLGFAAIEHQTQFAKESFTSVHNDYESPLQDTLFVSMKSDDTLINRKTLYRSSLLEPVNIESNSKDLFSTYVHIDIRRSNSDQLVVKVLKSARGFNTDYAEKKAKEIKYDYTFDNNQLDLNAYFLTPKDLEHNKPKIDVIIYVPDDQIISMDQTTKPFLYDINNIQDLYDRDIPDHIFKMTTKGLDCLDCIETNDKKEFVDVDIDKSSLNITVDDGENQAKIKLDKDGIEIK